jgi:pantothenate kinase
VVFPDSGRVCAFLSQRKENDGSLLPLPFDFCRLNHPVCSDHGIGDPVPGDVVVDAAQHAVALIEGNYLLLEQEPWCKARPLLDDAWYVDCPLDTAMSRVLARQVGLGLTHQESQARIASNDRPNALLIAASASRAALLVPSDVPLMFQD